MYMMRTLRKISFVGYLLVALGVAANGILYMTTKEIMSYHQIAMGVPWGQLSDGMQVMSLNFMKSAGVGFVTTGVSILLLALFPFRRGNKWADYAIPLVASVELIPMILRVMDVAGNTPANPPLFPLIGAEAVVVVCFALTYIESKQRKIKNT